jgi:hypothetical protein
MSMGKALAEAARLVADPALAVDESRVHPTIVVLLECTWAEIEIREWGCRVPHWPQQGRKPPGVRMIIDHAIPVDEIHVHPAMLTLMSIHFMEVDYRRGLRGAFILSREEMQIVFEGRRLLMEAAGNSKEGERSDGWEEDESDANGGHADR